MRSKLVIFLACIGAFREYPEDFHNVFKTIGRISLRESRSVTVGQVQAVEIDKNDNIWIIDWNSGQLVRLNKEGRLPELVARKGKGPGELALPQSLHISRDRHVFVANLLRKVTEYDSSGRYLFSFIPTDGHMPTTCVGTTHSGLLLLGGRKIPGKMIHLYSRKGKYLRSFYDVDENTLKKNLAGYAAAYFDTDEQGRIYCVQPSSYMVTVFDQDGERRLKIIGRRPSHYREPKVLTEQMRRNKELRREFERSFTYTMHVWFDSGLVIVLSRNDVGATSPEFQFYLDIYDALDGSPRWGSIKSEHELVAVRRGRFYFLKQLEKGVGDVEHALEICIIKGED